jgi:transcriptional antiterminator NusG
MIEELEKTEQPEEPRADTAEGLDTPADLPEAEAMTESETVPEVEESPEAAPEESPDAEAVSDSEESPDAEAVSDSEESPDAEAVAETEESPEAEPVSESDESPDVEAPEEEESPEIGEPVEAEPETRESPDDQAMESPVEEAEAPTDMETPSDEEAPPEIEAAPAAAAAEAPAEEESTASTEAAEEPVVVSDGDPFSGPGDWYVIHTYAGYENKVKTNLGSRIQTMQMQDKIFDVVVPMEDVMEIKGGRKQVVQKKVFPGYLLVKMVYDNDSWYVVRNTPGVTGFVASGTGQKPTPLPRREVEKFLAAKSEEIKPAFRLEFEEGDVVRIISGPFTEFTGTISEINVDQSKLKVMVNIFDRETPVELGFEQVAKV